MNNDRERLAELMSCLKQQRDELALQVHLANAEAKQEWARVQKKLDKLSDDFQPISEAVGESAEGLLASLRLVADEVVESFQRIPCLSLWKNFTPLRTNNTKTSQPTIWRTPFFGTFSRTS